jgi:hypothetical protein
MASVKGPQDIVLTPFEARLCALLREVVELYSPSTVVRIAGGWVRDKVRAERGPLAEGFCVWRASAFTFRSANVLLTHIAHPLRCCSCWARTAMTLTLLLTTALARLLPIT